MQDPYWKELTDQIATLQTENERLVEDLYFKGLSARAGWYFGFMCLALFAYTLF